MSTFRMIHHLLPRGRAWKGDNDNLWTALAAAGDNAQEFAEAIWANLDPNTTVDLDEWEAQFGLPPDTGLSDAERRTRLLSAWQILTVRHQTLAYVQARIQDAGFTNLFVHEAAANGTPDPRVLLGPTGPEFGEPDALCGEPDVLCGDASTAAIGYALVNKITQTVINYLVVCGTPAATSGNPTAQAGEFSSFRDLDLIPTLPQDPNTFPFFVYVGGQTFPDPATSPDSRRLELEQLVLQVFPAQQWVGMLVQYT